VDSVDDSEELQASRSPHGSTQALRSRGRDMLGQTDLLLAYRGEYVALCMHTWQPTNAVRHQQIKSNQTKFNSKIWQHKCLTAAGYNGKFTGEPLKSKLYNKHNKKAQLTQREWATAVHV